MNGMADFWSSAAELRRFWAWIIATAALPFMAKFIEIAPPWPPAIPVLTSLVTLLSLVLVYQFFRMAARRTVNRVMGIGLFLLFLCSLIYLALLSEMTFAVPGTATAGIKGFACTEVAETAFPGKCPWLGEAELKTAEWTAENLWLTWSITLTRLAIVASWLASFLFLSIVLASFINYQRRQTVKV
jgi:hypothetical protein